MRRGKRSHRTCLTGGQKVVGSIPITPTKVKPFARTACGGLFLWVKAEKSPCDRKCDRDRFAPFAWKSRSGATFSSGRAQDIGAGFQRQSVSLETAMALTGHRSVATVMKYYREVSQEELASAVKSIDAPVARAATEQENSS